MNDANQFRSVPKRYFARMQIENDCRNWLTWVGSNRVTFLPLKNGCANGVWHSNRNFHRRKNNDSFYISFNRSSKLLTIRNKLCVEVSVDAMPKSRAEIPQRKHTLRVAVPTLRQVLYGTHVMSVSPYILFYEWFYSWLLSVDTIGCVCAKQIISVCALREWAIIVYWFSFSITLWNNNWNFDGHFNFFQPKINSSRNNVAHEGNIVWTHRAIIISKCDHNVTGIWW